MDPKAMPFDMKRMVYGGFKTIVNLGKARARQEWRAAGARRPRRRCAAASSNASLPPPLHTRDCREIVGRVNPARLPLAPTLALHGRGVPLVCAWPLLGRS